MNAIQSEVEDNAMLDPLMHHHQSDRAAAIRQKEILTLGQDHHLCQVLFALQIQTVFSVDVIIVYHTLTAVIGISHFRCNAVVAEFLFAAQKNILVFGRQKDFVALPLSFQRSDGVDCEINRGLNGMLIGLRGSVIRSAQLHSKHAIVFRDQLIVLRHDTLEHLRLNAKHAQLDQHAPFDELIVDIVEVVHRTVRKGHSKRQTATAYDNVSSAVRLVKREIERLTKVILPRVHLAEQLRLKTSTGEIFHVDDGQPTVGKRETNMPREHDVIREQAGLHIVTSNDVIDLAAGIITSKPLHVPSKYHLLNHLR